MRGFKAFAFAATASVLLAGSLQAQWTGTMKWGGIKNPSLTGYFGYKASTGAITDVKNVFVSPYLASFKIPGQTPPLNPALLPPAGTADFGPNWDIFCVDYLHGANTNTVTGYSANFTNLDKYGTEGGKTRLGTSGLTRYLMAAWLAQEISRTPNTTVVGRDARLDMNGAIWQIMTGYDFSRSTNGVNWQDSGIHTWLGNAVAGVANHEVNAANWVVVTDANLADGPNSANPTAGGDHQEFLTQVTPEPATMLLLGTGLVVMLMAAGALRRPVA